MQTASNVVTQPMELTPEMYLAIERSREFKSEFANGAMFAMAGASEAHNLIVAHIVRDLGVQLKGRPCRVYPSDMRVRIPQKKRYVYPDAIVVCGEPRFEDDHRDTLLNPTVIVEVLSPSTETYDRVAKFAAYRTIASLQAYLLISQDKPLLECYARQEGTRFWLFSDAAGREAAMELSAIAVRLALADVYEHVEFNPTLSDTFDVSDS